MAPLEKLQEAELRPQAPAAEEPGSKACAASSRALESAAARAMGALRCAKQQAQQLAAAERAVAGKVMA